MFGWIDRIFNWGTANIGGAIIAWVRDFVRGVWGFIDTLFGHVGDAWHEIYMSGVRLVHGMETLGGDVYDALFRLFRIALPNLMAWIVRQITRIVNDILSLANRLATDVINLTKRIVHDVAAALQWVIVHVYDPLARDFLRAWNWITTRGEEVFYYISHPDKLAALIFDNLLALLEREAWSVGNKLGSFFLSLVIHNLQRFVTLLEDILMAVF